MFYLWSLYLCLIVLLPLAGVILAVAASVKAVAAHAINRRPPADGLGDELRIDYSGDRVFREFVRVPIQATCCVANAMYCGLHVMPVATPMSVGRCAGFVLISALAGVQSARDIWRGRSTHRKVAAGLGPGDPP